MLKNIQFNYTRSLYISCWNFWLNRGIPIFSQIEECVLMWEKYLKIEKECMSILGWLKYDLTQDRKKITYPILKKILTKDNLKLKVLMIIQSQLWEVDINWLPNTNWSVLETKYIIGILGDLSRIYNCVCI